MIKPIYIDCEFCEGKGKVPRGEYLRQLRRAKGLHLRDVAKKMGKTMQYLSDIERGRRRATPEIARGYGL